MLNINFLKIETIYKRKLSLSLSEDVSYLHTAFLGEDSNHKNVQQKQLLECSQGLQLLW